MAQEQALVIVNNELGISSEYARRLTRKPDIVRIREVYLPLDPFDVPDVLKEITRKEQIPILITDLDFSRQSPGNLLEDLIDYRGLDLLIDLRSGKLDHAYPYAASMQVFLVSGAGLSTPYAWTVSRRALEQNDDMLHFLRMSYRFAASALGRDYREGMNFSQRRFIRRFGEDRFNALIFNTALQDKFLQDYREATAGYQPDSDKEYITYRKYLNGLAVNPTRSNIRDISHDEGGLSERALRFLRKSGDTPPKAR